MSRQEQAATKAQAAFKGYLARRAFRALKGIIRLQALIRGHLVRRQAVATLCCMQAIVKLQALARGQQVDVGANSFFGSEKLATNAFVHKLLVSVPTAMPLSFQYDVAEPNSAWNWLERWSVSHFWKTPAPTKRIMKTSQKKQGGAQVVEPEAGKSKRTIRKVSGVANVENSVLASSETDTTKRNARKVASNQTELVQEQPQNELERVKRNLRKISALAASEKSETENEKAQPLKSVEIATSYAPSDVFKRELVTSENLADSDIVVDMLDLLEAPSKTTMDEPVDVTHENRPAVEIHSLKNGLKMECSLTLDNELSCKEEHNDKENHKIQKRRSLLAMQESPENISQKSRSLPSYMAATESAKAKLRAQGYSNFDEDGTEHGITRRHSLPASSNGKLSSSSPRLQKHVQANGKGGRKINGSLTSSRDDKVVQPGWRR